MSQSNEDRDEIIRQLVARVETLEKGTPSDRLTLGVMSGDLDYTIAAFIIAVGAAAFDMEVDMFFTFWATAALRDPKKRVKKGVLDTMFGLMLPRGSKKLPLSKMHMAGIGPGMIRHVMRNRGAAQLEDLMKEAADMGVRIHVCTMSMDIMGIKKEELIDYPNLSLVGVGTFIDMLSHSKQCWFM
ncbi:DsrE/DsrF/DrsH-like family protein [Candidatus Fermentibacteria bacterium]|nr:DsrE/DsrF/DrsH-like family protein [Candidatus Fermentibacteria bacterium]